MSLPPTTVKIKRKRNEEPVDFLRVHATGGKRQRTEDRFIFSLQSAEEISHEPSNLAASQAAPHPNRPIKPLHRSASSNSLARHNVQPKTQSSLSQTQSVEGEYPAGQVPKGHHKPAAVPSASSRVAATGLQMKPTTMRRFHISRSSVSDPRSDAQAGIRKRKVEPTIFVERRFRPKPVEASQIHSLTAEPTTPLPDGQLFESDSADFKTKRPQKRPGMNARKPVPRSRDRSPPKSSTLSPAPTKLRNPLPSGLVNRWEVSSEQLVAEMQAYTLREIGLTLAESNAPKPAPQQLPKAPAQQAGSRFKPKRPALRYAERHPEELAGSRMEVDENYGVEEDMDSDGDYIIDTYVRIPAEAMDDSETKKNIGLLVLDSQPDIDDFYKDDDDSDEEDDEDDEDENAENHYTADYPDEEVDTDDEYGLNAYNYRNHNASDLEEFDELDATFSDDENDGTKYPWAAKPWIQRTADTDSDEDKQLMS